MDNHDVRVDSVFQRITSAKDERTATGGSVLGGILYFGFCFVPMFLAYASTLIDPAKFGALLVQNSQLVMPTLFFSILRASPKSCSLARCCRR